MKATVNRTLQAPQYAPITMTLEEECTPETFVLTLNKLADLIENTLRERYPQYSNVLPIVQKKADKPQMPIVAKEPSIQVKREDNSKRKDLYSAEINACTTMNQLEEYKAIAQTYGLMKEWEIKSIFIRTDAQIYSSQPQSNTLCTQ